MPRFGAKGIATRLEEPGDSIQSKERRNDTMFGAYFDSIFYLHQARNLAYAPIEEANSFQKLESGSHSSFLLHLRIFIVEAFACYQACECTAMMQPVVPAPFRCLVSLYTTLQITLRSFIPPEPSDPLMPLSPSYNAHAPSFELCPAS